MSALNTRKKRNEPIDGWDGLAKTMAKKCTVQHSQCEACLNKIGTHVCKIFGERPMKYASALTNLQCPNREEKE